MGGSFFTQNGYSPQTAETFQDLVNAAIQGAGAIGPKSITIVNPTGLEDVTLFYVNAPVTVQQITASVKGTTPSITATLSYGPSPTAAGTPIVTGGIALTDTTVLTSFDNATIPADSYVRLVTSSKSGTVEELAISLDF